MYLTLDDLVSGLLYLRLAPVSGAHRTRVAARTRSPQCSFYPFRYLLVFYASPGYGGVPWAGRRLLTTAEEPCTISNAPAV